MNDNIKTISKRKENASRGFVDHGVHIRDKH